MTVLHRHQNMPTWYLRCDRCGQHTWHEDAASEPQAPHICSDCEYTSDTPDETAALEAAVRWGQSYRDVHRDRAGDLWSVMAHPIRRDDGCARGAPTGGLFVHVVSVPTGALDAIVIVYQMEDRLEAGISSWRLPCSLCGRMAGNFRAELASS